MRLKIHWFSPLPPARSGIADYTAQVLPYLCAIADVVLWTDQSSWDSALERHASVRRFRSDSVRWTDVRSSAETLEVPVYHMGNNGPLHQAIWEVSRAIPGVVVLHDTRLQHFFAHVLRDSYRDEAQYVGVMTRFYGDEGKRRAQVFCHGGCSTESMAEAFPLASFAATNSLAAVVHSPESLALLTQEGYRPAADLALPYVATSESPVRAPGPPFRIVICGFLGPNRRLDSFLEALGEFSGRDRFSVEVYGTVWDPAYIQGIIARHGLGDIVSLKGFTPLRQLEAGLRGAHLAVNLRFPTMGEASMSQLQLWDHGLPTMVTPVGWYAYAPKGTVLYVRPDREREDIQRILEEFLADPEPFYALGNRGREVLLEAHRPQDYVARLAEILGRAPEFGLRHLLLSLAGRIGSDLREWLPRECAEVVASRVADEASLLFTHASEGKVERVP